LCGHMRDQEDDPTFTRLMLVRGNGSWGLFGDFQDIAYGLTVGLSKVVTGRIDLYALGRDGVLCIRLAPSDPVNIQVPVKDRAGYLEGICLASDGVYVCGSQREIQRYANGQWSMEDEGLFVPRTSGAAGPTLFALVETVPGTLLTVGSSGFAARRVNGGNWETLDVPTNMDLYCVMADAEGGAWIGGAGGTLLHLSPDASHWKDFSNPEISVQTFDSMAMYQGHVYVTAMNQLLSLSNDGKLTAVEGPFLKDSEFHAVSASDDCLWVTGDEHVYRYGPEGWEHLLCPDNAP